MQLSQTPAQVDDALREELIAALGQAGLVELTSAIVWENHRARMNRALGVRPAGFSDGAFCALPEWPSEPSK